MTTVHPRRRDEPGDGGGDVRADARGGARRDGVHPACPAGAPVVFRSFASSMSMQSGAPTFGTPEPALVLYVMAPLRGASACRSARAALTAAKVADAQAAYESANTMQPTMLAGVNFVLHAAGWLEAVSRWGTRSSCSTPISSGCSMPSRPASTSPTTGRRWTPSSPTSRGRTSSGTPHARELRAGVLQVAGRRQLELRAVGERGRPGRRPPGERDLEADARPRTRSRRSTRRSTRSSASGSRGERRHSPTRASDGRDRGRPRVARRGAAPPLALRDPSSPDGVEQQVLAHVPQDVKLTSRPRRRRVSSPRSLWSRRSSVTAMSSSPTSPHAW